MRIHAKAICLTVIWVASAAQIQAQMAQIAERYDRFKDQKTFKAEPVELLKLNDHEMVMTAEIQSDPKGKRPVLFFESLHAGPLYFSYSNVIFMVDGERLPAGEAYTDGSVAGRGKFDLERMRLVLRPGLLQKIVAGQIVEMQMGPTEITFNPKAMAMLRALERASSEQSNSRRD